MKKSGASKSVPVQRDQQKGGAILTLITARSAVEPISQWVADVWAKPVVELKPPGRTGKLEIYFNNTIEAKLAACVLEGEVLGSSVREYADEEWTESWKKHFKSTDIGSRLCVVPPWLVGQSDRIELVINPGLSFGTGNHFTTRFCLEQLDRLVPKSGVKTMLDIGSGSGILAIAAVKLGVERAVGVDWDPQCIQSGLENAQANGVSAQTSFRQHDIADGWPHEKYDLVCANLYSSLLMDHAATLLRAARTYLLLTGIRELELDGVADTFVQLGGRELVRDGDGEWGGVVIRTPQSVQ